MHAATHPRAAPCHKPFISGVRFCPSQQGQVRAGLLAAFPFSPSLCLPLIPAGTAPFARFTPRLPIPAAWGGTPRPPNTPQRLSSRLPCNFCTRTAPPSRPKHCNLPAAFSPNCRQFPRSPGTKNCNASARPGSTRREPGMLRVPGGGTVPLPPIPSPRRAPGAKTNTRGCVSDTANLPGRRGKAAFCGAKIKQDPSLNRGACWAQRYGFQAALAWHSGSPGRRFCDICRDTATGSPSWLPFITPKPLVPVPRPSHQPGSSPRSLSRTLPSASSGTLGFISLYHKRPWFGKPARCSRKGRINNYRAQDNCFQGSLKEIFSPSCS